MAELSIPRIDDEPLGVQNVVTALEREVVLHRHPFLSYNEAQAGKLGLIINDKRG